jgi:hypothetical protein
MLSDRDVRLARRAGWPVAVTAFIGAFVLLAAAPAPARADSNFERGFEDQMGRILAYEAVNLGKHILVRGVLHPHHAVHHGSPYPYPYPYAYYGSDRHYGGGHRGKGPAHNHWKRHDHDRGYWNDRHRGHSKHHRHDRHCHH